MKFILIGKRNKVMHKINLFYKRIYSIICRLYSEIVSLFENLFLKSNLKSKSTLEKDGFLQINKHSELNISKKRFDFILNNSDKSFYSNRYQKKIILNRESLKSVIKLIFDKEFCDFLTSQTGFKYTIDFFGAYQNLHIPEEHLDQPWYANHYHLDKPNSRNMLKIFIPMSNIGINDGPLVLLDINQTKQYLLKRKSIEDVEKICLVGGLGDIFLCKLNLCLHKATIPKYGATTDLIMMQLNPSSRWNLNSNIYKRQFKTEPKFTTLVNTFVLRTPLY